MMPYFVIDQINIGPLRLYTWGLFVGLGFLAGYLLLLYLSRKKNLALEKVVWLALSVFVGGFLGARLLYILQEPQNFFYNLPLIFDKSGGGMFIGGLLGAIFLAWPCVRLAKLDLWQVADLLVLPTCLGIGIGRLGCFLINDHQGTTTNLPWGILWPSGVIRHPVALYESLVGFLLLAIFFIFQKYLFQGGEKKILPTPPFLKEGVPPFVKGRLGGILKTPGNLFLLFLLSYSVIRFFLDFTRESQGFWADVRWGAFTVSQWIALLLFVFVAGFWARKKR